MGEKVATQAIRGPDQWADKAIQDGLGQQKSEILNPETQALEMIMMGLRLEEGINQSSFLA